jgi:hypothetical protein
MRKREPIPYFELGKAAHTHFVPKISLLCFISGTWEPLHWLRRRIVPFVARLHHCHIFVVVLILSPEWT